MKFDLRQVQELQSRLAKSQQELGEMTVEVSVGGGVVKVVIDGHQKFHSVFISPEVIKAEEADLLQDLVLAVMNEAVQKSQELAANHLSKITGGLKMPGLF